MSASFETGAGETLATNYVQADSFTRDALGRITRIASAVPNGGSGAGAGQVTGQCFRYDGFNRLASAWTVAGTGAVGACATSAPTSSENPSWDASATSYATQWTYSKSGQISTIVNNAVMNGTSTPVTANLTYGQSGAPASGVTTMTDGSTTNTYAYDGAGRQTTRTINGVAATLSWDVSSNLVETSGAGGDLLYVYDSSGQRVAKIQVPNEGNAVTGQVTGYVGATELTDADTSANAANPADLEGAGFIIGTRYYAFGGATVAVRQVTAGEGGTIPEPDPSPSPTPSPTPSASPSASPSPSPSMSPSVTPSASPSASPSPSAPPSVSPTPRLTPSPTPSPSPSAPPASSTTATSNLSLLFGDEQGSAQVMMQVTLSASGAMAPAEVTDPINRNAYTPYGAVRGADNLAIDHGWLNQASDEASTGLVYLNARYYDLDASRFVSPDPLMDPADPRTLDAFRYSENNPVTYTDATGLCSTTGSWAYVGGVLEPPCDKSNGDQYDVPAPTKPDVNHGDSGWFNTGGGPGGPPVLATFIDPTEVLQATTIAYQTMQEWLADGLSKYFEGYSDKKQLNYAVQCGAEEGKSLSIYGNGSCYLIKGKSARMLLKLDQLRGKFQPYGPWDLKPTLVARLNLPGDASDPTRRLHMGGGQTMYYDVLGNVQYGYMMAGYGVTPEMAILASKASGSGNRDGTDDVAIQIGYDMRAALGEDFTAGQMYDFILNPGNRAALADAGKIHFGAG